MIAEGEHQRLDFKFEISDSSKIARTMSAFANTDGGRLLIGVKDNGVVAGVRTDEEIYMAEGAARLHCRPEVPIRAKEWDVDGRKVVEILVTASANKPHFAKDPHGRWRAYFRQADQNFVANPVLMQLWKRQKEPKGVIIRYREQEKVLLEYLELNRRISQSRFQKIAGLGRRKAEDILVNFIILGFIRMRQEGDHVVYEAVDSSY